jgi:hypothetical protein
VVIFFFFAHLKNQFHLNDKSSHETRPCDTNIGTGRGVVAPTCNPSTREAEAGRGRGLQFEGSRLCSETLSQKHQETKKERTKNLALQLLLVLMSRTGFDESIFTFRCDRCT